MRHPEAGERFEVKGSGSTHVVHELVLASNDRGSAPRWLVRTADGQLWRLRLRDGSLTRGPRYEGQPHWSGPQG
ncbi:MAG: hypothetical protein JWL60_2657 [Gemmatimonadetes bacterium]|jgi:hypothetical protein|nr:hypothetical protein [Gemmatimonadota bacterium]